MRHYLTVKTGDIPNVREVYKAFKDYARSPNVAKAGVEALVADIRVFSRYFCAMALGAEPDPDLKLAFHDLRELKVDVAYPFLLELYHDYVTGVLPCADLVTVVRLVEAYVFRRAICAIPTNSMNKTFATFAKALKKDRYLESVQAAFLLWRSYRRFPADDEFRRDLQTRDLYNFRTPRLLASPTGKLRAQGARAGGRIHDRTYHAAERESACRLEDGARPGMGAHPARPGSIRSET